MRDLQDMNIGQRVMVTVVIVVVILLLLTVIGYLSGRWEVEAAPVRVEAAPVPVPSPYEARLIVLDREAMDNAYRNKLEQLFSVWLKDDSDQPARAITGANQARKAYTAAMNEIERRQRLQQ